MPVPADRRYTKTHEWHLPADGLVTIGITQFAADELTDITYVELPKIGQTIQAGAPFGEIESVKATGDLNSGVSGTVKEINENLAGAPELVNSDPFGAAWMIKVAIDNPAELDALLSAEDYERMIAG
ncbi:MAG: glycine cleavage system protein GcvH [Phycisphaerae bacterium]|nr:glycine cleavage system protein GcvH [Phycisphaerae bacterium]